MYTETQKQIAELLTNNPTGSSFANIKTKTNPVRPSKKAQTELELMFPCHSKIVKVGSRNVSIGNTYTTAVNNRLEKNGVDNKEFKAQERTWAVRLTSGLVSHKDSGELYVEYYYLNSNKSTYSYEWEDGTPLTNEELLKAKTLFKKSSPSKKQSEAGLDNEEQIKVNLVKLSNVISLHAFGKAIDKPELTIA